MNRSMRTTNARALRLLAVCVVASACFDAVEPVGPTEPVPFLEYLKVEAGVGTTGRTFIAWSHPEGVGAITGQPTTVRFTTRTPDGQNRVETVSEPFDTRSPSPGVIEHEYRFGASLMEIRATQQDVAGRSVVYECFAPDWACFRQ